MVEKLTPMSEDFNEWYTDIIQQAQLADYSPVKGTMVIRPYGYSIWESVQSYLDKKFKETGHQNAYFPLFIPNSFIQKEAEHVEGFSPELAMVTHAGGKELEEPLVVRPTSETIINHMFAKWIKSHRDLPMLINQWANVVRWEMRTRLFLRTSEFLWQEGHTAHSTEKEAVDEALKILDIYKNVVENIMAIPILTGYKSESEKFAGAVETYCIEAMMGDKKALQAGTSHYLGQNFAKAFDVKFQNIDNKEEYVYATSWGVSTRLIGALIMVHGDDKGLRLPPKLAPIQVVIIPIFKSDEDLDKIKNYLENMIQNFKNNSIRYHLDDRKKMSPGFKFNEWEMKGVPLRIEIGPRDMKDKKIFIARRDTSEKFSLDINNSYEHIKSLLKEIQNNLFQSALKFREDNTFEVKDYDEFKKIVKKGGFIKCGWDGSQETEDKIKKETKATIRCIPFDNNIDGLFCIYSGKPAKYSVIFSKAY